MDHNYVLALTQGNYVVFAGRGDGTAIGMGVMFGVVGVLAYSAATANQTKLDVLNISTGNISPLSKAYIKYELKEFPDLEKQFKAEAKQTSSGTLMKYVLLLNERLQNGLRN